MCTLCAFSTDNKDGLSTHLSNHREFGREKGNNSGNETKFCYISDSVGLNVDFTRVEREAIAKVKTYEAYSVINDDNAKYPEKTIPMLYVKLFLLGSSQEQFGM